MRKKQNVKAILICAALMTMSFAFTALADWEFTDGSWYYRNSNGELATDTWKTDDGKQYWLGSNGVMAESTLLEINDYYYHVNSSGAMSTNEWRLLENPSWQGDSLVGYESWYYFGPNGRAYASRNEKAAIEEIDGKKYAFDSYGRMMTGWISESGEYVDSDDWENGLYYANPDGSGNICVNEWAYIQVTDYDNEDDNYPVYHFYFGSNGKKTTDSNKTINSTKSLFDDRGVSVYGWDNSSDSGWRYYGDIDDPYLRTGWFQAVPSEELDSEGYEYGDEYWFYASSNGYIYTSQIKTIDSKIYGFNSAGEMLTGLTALTLESEDSKVIVESSEIEYWDEMPSGVDDDRVVYYFDDNSGAAKTGITTLDLDGESCTFSFRTSGSSKGAGYNTINGGYVYDHGMRLKAESGSKYGVVSGYDDDGNEAEFLVNESGSIQKKKTNVKDADGYYYCTDSDGIVTYGPADEKYSS